MPLQFTSDGQINAVIPYDIPVNSIQQMLVRKGTSYSVPEHHVKMYTANVQAALAKKGGVLTPLVSSAGYVAFKEREPFVPLGGRAHRHVVEQHAAIALVNADMMRVLRGRPLLGRGFTTEDNLPAVPTVALLTHDFWRTRFAGDSQVIGRTVTFDGRPVEIIGVLAAGGTTVTLANTASTSAIADNVNSMEMRLSLMKLRFSCSSYMSSRSG